MLPGTSETTKNRSPQCHLAVHNGCLSRTLSRSGVYTRHRLLTFEMASRQQQQVPYAAGIYADMTVDGPEIGTLVMVCDRAKNLPNRKTMGKQSAYCAARLGKEAKKTPVDKRGGQTPRW